MLKKLLNSFKFWWFRRPVRAKQEAAARTGSRYYGDGVTIHGNTSLDIETFRGEVVSVWFRCCPLPFKQTEVELHRANEMRRMTRELKHELRGIETREKTS